MVHPHTSTLYDDKQYKTALHKAAMYRDIVEGLQAENRLRSELSDKVETVGSFWRNRILEQRTRAEKMVMLATCK